MGMPKIIVETTVTSDGSYQGKSLKSFLPCKWLENYLFYNFKHRDYFAVINCYSAFFSLSWYKNGYIMIEKCWVLMNEITVQLCHY